MSVEEGKPLKPAATPKFAPASNMRPNTTLSTIYLC